MPKDFLSRIHWVYLIVLVPTLTNYMEHGKFSNRLTEVVANVILTLILFVLAFTVTRQVTRLATLAETDLLTGLLNRRKFDQDLQREIARAQRQHTPLVLAYLDVDAFKAINDSHGHAAGDAVLVNLANVLKRMVRRDVDGCYRIGGDEFCVLMPGLDRAGAVAVMDRIRVATREQLLAPGLRGASVSIGIVSLEEGDSPDELLKRADDLMYKAKRQTIDRLTYFDAWK